MQIITKNISEIKPYENNPRNNADAIDKVAESIKEYGILQPLVIDRDGVIVVGHTRYEACKNLGVTDVPCIVADNLTEKQAKGYRIADNKTSDYSIWDNKKLLEELSGLDGIFTGFTESEYFSETVEMIDEKDNTILDDNEDGIKYKLTVETANKDIIDAIISMVQMETENE